MKSILDPSFKYTHSSKTDLKKTFARIKRLQAEKAAEVVEPQPPHLVIILKQRGEK